MAAAASISTVYVMVGISVAFALSFGRERLARRGEQATRVPPRKVSPFSAGALVRGRLMDGEAAAAGAASGSRARGKTIPALPFTRAGASRNWATLLVAFLGLAAAAGYMADGVEAAHWLLPCVGIPVIVGLVNLLGSSDR